MESCNDYVDDNAAGAVLAKQASPQTAVRQPAESTRRRVTGADVARQPLPKRAVATQTWPSHLAVGVQLPRRSPSHSQSGEPMRRAATSTGSPGAAVQQAAKARPVARRPHTSMMPARPSSVVAGRGCARQHLRLCPRHCPRCGKCLRSSRPAAPHRCHQRSASCGVNAMTASTTPCEVCHSECQHHEGKLLGTSPSHAHVGIRAPAARDHCALHNGSHEPQEPMGDQPRHKVRTAAPRLAPAAPQAKVAPDYLQHREAECASVLVSTAADQSAISHMSSSTFPQAALGFDEATLQLERLVEQTHQSLLRDGLIAGCGGDAAAAGALPLPSLDAVDKALEELQRGLAEIDGVLAQPPA